MRKFLATLYFALGFTLTFALVAGVDIYLFEHFERAWGKGISFQVSLWVIAAGAVIAALSFWMGATVFKSIPKNTSSFACGATFAVVVSGASWVGKVLMVSSSSLQVLLAALMLLGGFAVPSILALFNRRQSGEQDIIVD